MVVSRSMTRLFAVLVALLLATACKSGDESAEGTAEEANTEESAEVAAEQGDEVAVPERTEEAQEDPGTYEPGDASVRILNLGNDAVDLYVRTTGRVRAFPIQEGLAVGEVSEFFALPDGGAAVITRAGAGDPTCFQDCDHILGQVRASQNTGNTLTGIVAVNRDRESVTVFWENAPESDNNYSNAIAAPNDEQATVVVSTPSLHEHRYGLRLAFGSSEGCVVPSEESNILVGGNQTHTLLFGPGSEEVFLYALSDRECAEEPVAGPFAISGEAGERYHLILRGAPEAIEAMVLPMAPAEAAAEEDASVAGDEEGEADEAGDEQAEDEAPEAAE